jgi:hypothetical protein
LTGSKDDEHVSKVAITPSDACQLLEPSFEYVRETRQCSHISQKEVAEAKMTERIPKWAGRDLDSRPFGYQPNALTKLSYRPALSGIKKRIKKEFIKTFLD